MPNYFLTTMVCTTIRIALLINSYTLVCTRVTELYIFLQFIRPTDSNTTEGRIVDDDDTASTMTTMGVVYHGRPAGIVLCLKLLELYCMQPYRTV